MVNKSATSIHCLSTDHDANADMFLQILMIIEMIMGLPGSVLALWIFCFRIRVWKPHIIFLFNLVLADFLLLVSVPFRIDVHHRQEGWVLGPTWCSINLFMLNVNRTASIAFMTVVALDRYFKVVHPLRSISKMSSAQALWLTGLIWIAVFVLGTPLLATNLLHEHGNANRCRSFDSYEVTPLPIKIYYVSYIVEFFLPWLLLLFCSAQIIFHLHRRKVNNKKWVRCAVRAVVVISVVFTLCFMPSVITGLLGSYIKVARPNDCKTYIRVTRFFKICIGFTYLNSALDPIIYVFSSSVFRATLRNVISFKKKETRPASSTY
ncbi:hydroxycarboxylic acid receptor 3 [Mugil cephalus]|uniref:hydroxycarboxylic acid receptor 3 n=1 Tax=Mugil cephalus TaxID=48193 RepID=UPI001FB78DE4|nr:hydroxycarboxylic acid receptor 3 [Mugil cephalus]